MYLHIDKNSLDISPLEKTNNIHHGKEDDFDKRSQGWFSWWVKYAQEQLNDASIEGQLPQVSLDFLDQRGEPRRGYSRLANLLPSNDGYRFCWIQELWSREYLFIKRTQFNS